MWISSQWACLMFSDEYRFSLQTDSHRTFIRKFQESSITNTSLNDTVTMVQDCSFGVELYWASEQICMFRLEHHLYLFRCVMGIEFVYMNDNVRPHHAHIVKECPQSEDITRMEWSAFSLDLNPIQYVWDMLGQQITAHQ
ncbi:hypothetical protein X975_19909, partial [Stegodyphus mimosarum]